MPILIAKSIEFLLNGTKIHWILDYVGIVWNLEGLSIYRLMEYSCSLMLPKHLNNLFGCFLPAVKQLHGIGNVRNTELIQKLGVF